MASPKLNHAAGSQNTAADFLSRDDVITAPIEINLQSTDVADEEQLVFLPDEEEESEQGIFPRKELSKQQAIEDKKQRNLSTEITETVRIPLITSVYAFGAIEENARKRNEQDSDSLLKAQKLRLLHEECNTHLLKTKPRGRSLLRHEVRIVVKDGILMRKITERTAQSRTTKF